MITREQWAEIEKTLEGLLARAEFKFGEDKITVERRQIKEGRYELVVFFNDTIKGAWSHEPDCVDYQPLIQYFWRKSTRSLLRRSGKAEKLSKRLFEKINKKYVVYLPFWPKAKALVNHFKKIRDLEFIEKNGVSGF